MQSLKVEVVKIDENLEDCEKHLRLCVNFVNSSATLIASEILKLHRILHICYKLAIYKRK